MLNSIDWPMPMHTRQRNRVRNARACGEAMAIRRILSEDPFPRPLTHDLLFLVVEGLKAKIVRVVISDLRENTFFAVIQVQRNGEETAIDARPSDAIALALRADAPIFVRRDVLERAKAVDLATHATDDEKLKEWLEELNPEDLGKYTM